MLLILAIGLLLFPPIAASAQTAPIQSVSDVRFKRHDMSNGLSFNGVTTIAQDSVGFLWIGTRKGLNRYDGYTFTHYWHDPEDSTSLSGNEAHYVYVDTRGVVWVAGPTGLNRYDRERDAFTRFQPDPDDPSSLSHRRLCCVLEDREGILWVGSNDGLNRFDRETETFTHFKHDPNDPNSLSSGPVSGIYEDRSGTLWIGTLERYGGTGGLNRFDRQTETFERYVHDPNNEHTLIDNSIRSIYEDSYGTFWVGAMGEDALHTMHRKTGAFTRLTYDPTNPIGISQPRLRNEVFHTRLAYYVGVWAILEDKEGRLWFGAHQGGVDRYDPRSGEVRHYEYEANQPQSLGNNWPWTFYEDHSGAMWVADDASASLAMPVLFQKYQDVYSEDGNNILCILEDRTGAVWAGTTGGIRKVHRGSASFIPSDLNDEVLSSKPIHALLEDREGSIWLGTDEGLARWAPDTRELTWYRPLAENPRSIHDGGVHALFEDDSGRIWAGGKQGVISLLTPRDNSFTHLFVEENAVGDNMTSFYEDRSGQLWFMSANGIRTIDQASGTVGPDLKGFNHNSFIFEDRSGTLLLGSLSYGLHIWNRETELFEEFRTPSGLVVSGALGILEDDHGYLWISDKPGLVRYNPAEQTITYFKDVDGLPPVGFNRNSAHKGHSGTLYFGGPTGLFAFDPGAFAAQSPPPKMALTELRLSNTPVALGDDSPLKRHISVARSLTLKHDQNDIGLSFAAFDFRRPEDNLFRYKLEGYDEDWQGPTTDHRVNYTNLDPGRYTFRVRAANSDGVWNENGVSFHIRIALPWWQTVWAYSLYAFGLVGLVFGVDRYQRSRLIAKERLRAEQEKARAIASTNSELQRALKHLTETQDQLIHTEKMASLGQLTAGVAHEIKNPLNFVNNFAALCANQTEDIEEVLRKHQNKLPAGEAHELKSLLDDLKVNAQKIAEHGGRADGIIRSMLEHSRAEPGERRPVDLNKLLDEFVNLAYHGFRARSNGSAEAIRVIRAYDEALPKIEVVPQEMGRVFINILDNAFYAVQQSLTKARIDRRGYQPSITVSTEHREGLIDIRIEDNGIGIQKDIQDRIFEPFFTTKPTGSGTGLGLSLSYDIVTKGHGGTLVVESEEGEGARFIIQLPTRKDSHT